MLVFPLGCVQGHLGGCFELALTASGIFFLHPVRHSCVRALSPSHSNTHLKSRHNHTHTRTHKYLWFALKETQNDEYGTSLQILKEPELVISMVMVFV